MAGTLLVNFVYSPPVGHAVEALHAAHGYHLADPDMCISVVLHADTAIDLARLCPFVNKVYTVRASLGDPTVSYRSELSRVPAAWDWVVDAEHTQAVAYPGLASYYRQARRQFVASRSLGFVGSEPPAYRAGERLRFRIPPDVAARAEARFTADRPRIAVLPAGSDERWKYPTIRSWRRILDALLGRWPNAQLCLIGKHRPDGRTTTGFAAEEYGALRMAYPRVVELVDAPLVHQLAAVSACDAFISPHTGFGMAVLAVGTPWLCIAGNNWPEYYFNQTPFYSVLPDVARFPCFTGSESEPDPVLDEGPRSPSMCYERIVVDLDEIVDGAERLVGGGWDYDTAMRDHVGRMLALRGGDPSLLRSVDNVHARYLPDAL